ncbi:MAG: YhcG family protein [Bryobacteraceae bacterium]|nr:YhcG family protein [Bryobacteraceae bacterium]
MGKAKKPEGSEPALAVPNPVGELAADVRVLIETARLRVAQTVNAELVLLYWQIGNRIRRDVLGQTRAEYGEQIVSTLSRQLTVEYGAGFSRPNLFHMIRFVEAWPDQAAVTTLAQNLGWSHFKEILYLENNLARQFYAEMCRLERWSVRTLRERVRSMMFERTAISRLPEATIREDLQQLREADRLTPELVFRDPYLLDFLGLKDAYSERDLEAAILRELEHFLLELGTDFAFIARQKRMSIGNQDFYLDLLFYHRRLARLIAIDLKLGRFEAGYKGQMELYLRWLDQNERRSEHEEPPVGLILCSAKDEEQIELLQLNQGEIRVAEYLTALPAKQLLAAKLHDAVIRVREQLARLNPAEPQ